MTIISFVVLEGSPSLCCKDPLFCLYGSFVSKRKQKRLYIRTYVSSGKFEKNIVGFSKDCSFL